VVVNTHLHFDHAGGNTYRDAAGAVRLAFPDARYVVHRGEFDYATHTNERTAGSYLPPNFAPVAEAGRFDLVGEGAEIVPGVRFSPRRATRPFHQSVLVESAAETLCFSATSVPDPRNLPLP
jgi:metal-dependent hydrolase (beta-lactamase superfamily II)